jgi:DNA-binding MarR family transcriptional regulator
MPPRPRRETDGADALAAVALLATRWIERLLTQQHPPLTVAQYLALRAIAREGVSGTELARRSGVSGPAVSQLLAGLADDDLVARQPAEDDRRRVTLALTPAGKRTLRGAETLLRKRLSPLLQELPRPEADALSRALPALEAALSGAPPPRRPAPPPPPAAGRVPGRSGRGPLPR